MCQSRRMQGFLGGSVGKEATFSESEAGDMGLIPGLGRSPGGGHGNPLQYSCLGKSHGQRSLVGYSPWGLKDRTEAIEQACTQENVGTSRRFELGFLAEILNY